MRRHWLCMLLMLSWIIIRSGFPASAQDLQARITDVRITGDLVTIVYDLVADMEADYRVTLLILDDQNPLGPLELKRVTGDAGEGNHAGTGKRILWNMKDEGVKITEGGGYKFQLTITRIERGGGIPWYYYAGAGVIAVVVTQALLNKDEPGDVPPANTKSVPLPPVR